MGCPHTAFMNVGIPRGVEEPCQSGAVGGRLRARRGTAAALSPASTGKHHWTTAILRSPRIGLLPTVLLAIRRIVHAFRDYRRDAEEDVARWEHNYRRLPPHHQELLSAQPARFSRAREAIFTNQFLINSLLHAFEPDSDTGPVPQHLAGANAAGDEVAAKMGRASTGDLEKVRPWTVAVAGVDRCHHGWLYRVAHSSSSIMLRCAVLCRSTRCATC